MLLIPAIDLKGGSCVRLRQGDMGDATVYSENPMEVAQRWHAAGAVRLHIVDLDGAASGKPENRQMIHDIVEQFPGMEIQVGGGIRDEDTIEAYLDAGVRYVILGTKAVNAPHFVADVCLEFPGHILVGLDARDGRVAIDGWSKLSQHDVVDLARHFERDGVAGIIFTDIGRDGMLSGVNISATVKLAEAVSIPVFASGGIKNMADIEALCGVEESGVVGAVLGRALYEGSLDFAEAQRFANNFAK